MRNFTITVLNFDDNKVYQYTDNKSKYCDVNTEVFLIDKFCIDFNLNIKNIEYMLTLNEVQLQNLGLSVKRN